MVPSRGVRRGRAESAGGRPCRAVRSQRENGNGSVDRVSRRGAVLRARRQLQGARRLRDLPGAGGAAGEQSRRGADAGEVLMTEADGGGQGRTGSDKSIRRVSLAIIGAGALVVSSASVRLRPPSSAQSSVVLLATTTSTRDAGLLDSLLPIFERQSGYRVTVIAVGSGQALAMGRRGDADVVLSHAPEAERPLADSGYLLNRRLVMHNDFLFVGPAEDPAALHGLADAVAAMRRIGERHAGFVSRGDQSGTHLKELALWRRAGLVPAGAWYVESGQGMAATQQMADQKRAYTLTDRATYLAGRDKPQVVPMVEGDSLLFNVYHVMEVNPQNAPRVNTAGGRALADFFVSAQAQALIGAFGRSRFGQSLFVPDAGKPDRW